MVKNENDMFHFLCVTLYMPASDMTAVVTCTGKYNRRDKRVVVDRKLTAPD